MADSIFARKHCGRAQIQRHKQYTYPIIDVFLPASRGRRVGHTCSAYAYDYVYAIE